MQISESGRVVLIDDHREEIDPVLTTLGRFGIPYIYFDGSGERLPEKPLKGIRFIFLDIELQGMGGQQPPMKASGVVAILKKIIAKDNGPYVIGFWTDHKEVIPFVLDNCKDAGIEPITSVDLEKPAGLDQITERLQDKLKEIGAFQLYVEWENIVNTASKEFILSFSSLASSGPNWSKDTAALFYNLYKTFVGKDVTEEKEEQFKYACHLMNRSFFDTLENFTSEDLALPEGFNLENKELPDTVNAKLNTSLFLSTKTISRHYPGNVYNHNDDAIKDMLLGSIFKVGQHPGDIATCKVIISPECDIAQNKMTYIKGVKERPMIAHRILYGLLVPADSTDMLNDKGKEGYFKIGPIWHDRKEKTLIFHFATMSFHPEGEFKEPPFFSIKRDLLFDLQSKAANHVNRLGNYLITE